MNCATSASNDLCCFFYYYTILEEDIFARWIYLTRDSNSQDKDTISIPVYYTTLNSCSCLLLMTEVWSLCSCRCTVVFAVCLTHSSGGQAASHVITTWQAWDHYVESTNNTQVLNVMKSTFLYILHRIFDTRLATSSFGNTGV